MKSDDIRELWDEAIAAQTSEELDRVMPRLRQALHDHCEEIRARLVHYARLAGRLALQINELLPDPDAAHHGVQSHGQSPSQAPSDGTKKQ
ncbi:MAG: hypothetical protein WA211_19405 [Candidatus Acidiferrales bacterium]